MAVLTRLTVGSLSGVGTKAVAGAAYPPLAITANPIAWSVRRPGPFDDAGGKPVAMPPTPGGLRLAHSSPRGLKVNKSTGVIFSTPTKRAVSSTFTIEVLDTKVGRPKTQNTATATATATATFTITIGITVTAIDGGTHTCALLTGSPSTAGASMAKASSEMEPTPTPRPRKWWWACRRGGLITSSPDPRPPLPVANRASSTFPASLQCGPFRSCLTHPDGPNGEAHPQRSASPKK